MLTAPEQGIHDEPPTSLGVTELLAILRRLSRLLKALEDQAQYGGPAMLRNSWVRIGELLSEADRLAPAGARPPAAEAQLPPPVSADLVAAIGRAARLAQAGVVGSARWWLAVHALGRRIDDAHQHLAGLVADP